MPWDKILLAAAAGGAAMFVWNAIAWIALRHHNSDFRQFPGSKDVEQALSKPGLTAGFFQIPHWHDFEKGMKDPALNERFLRGPNAMIVMMRPGPCMKGGTFLLGYLLNFAEAFACALIYQLARGAVNDLPRTVEFFAGLGLLVGGAPGAAQSIWMGFPWSHTLKCTFDMVVGFALMGVVIYHIV